MLFRHNDHEGNLIDFDIAKISEAIREAFDAERDIDREIRDFAKSILEGQKEVDYQNSLLALEEKRRELRRYRKQLTRALNSIIRRLWLKRNAGAGRSKTSSVSEMLLMTVPTPPTAEAAICSLWQRGMACGMA